jgi:hypothetical protein
MSGHEAASCGRFYTRRCFLHERCVCVELLGVSDPPEACKVSFHARLNMSSLVVCSKATESQRQSEAQSEAIRCLSYKYRGQRRPSDAIRPHLRRNQTQSDAIRRNQAQSDAISMPGALCFRVLVFRAGRKGLCFVFLCFEPAQRACVLCFRVLAAPPQNTGGGQTQSGKSGSTANSYRFAHALISRWRLISEASLPVFRRNRGWGRIGERGKKLIAKG